MRGRPPLSLGTWGNIAARKTGSGWQASTYLRLHSGQVVRVRATARTKTASIAQVKARCATRLQTAHTADITPSTPLSTLIEHYLETKTDVTPQTRDRYEAAYRVHISPAIGQVRLIELTPPILDAFVRPLTPSTGAACMSVLKGALGMAVRYGIISSSPLTHIKPPKAGKKMIRALTEQQIPAFRADIAAHAKTLPNAHTAALLCDVIDLALSTGLRLGELLAIRWEDIGDGVIHVTGTIAYSKELGNVRQGWTKTESSTRTVQLGALAQALINRRRCEPWAAHAEMLFPSQSLTYMSEANFNRLFREAKKQKWNWVTVHTLRRTVATIINRQLGTRDAADLLGHSDMALTQRVYIAKNDRGVAIGEVIDGILRSD